MGNLAIRVQLTGEERKTLAMWVNAGRTEERLVKLARIILLATPGLPLQATSEEVGLSVNVCLEWRRRFIQGRLDGLKDRQRSGKPPTIESEQWARVI